MPDNRLTVRLFFAAVLALPISLSTPGFAKDIVPLQRGFYVQTDKKCEDAASAVLDLFLGNAFRFNCSVKFMRKIGNNLSRRHKNNELHYSVLLRI
jgi:hypothetical protein